MGADTLTPLGSDLRVLAVSRSIAHAWGLVDELA
jgi:hypothetical protein